MDPFRDPGPAALERVEALERENSALRAQLRVQVALAAAPDRAFSHGLIMACTLVAAAVAAMAYLGRCWP